MAKAKANLSNEKNKLEDWSSSEKRSSDFPKKKQVIYPCGPLDNYYILKWHIMFFRKFRSQ